MIHDAAVRSRAVPAVGTLALALASAVVVTGANARRELPIPVSSARAGLPIPTLDPPAPPPSTAAVSAKDDAGCAIADGGAGRYGPRRKLRTGSMRVPRPAPPEAYDVLLHLHGGPPAERLLMPRDLGLVLVTVDAGVGSKAYSSAMWGPEPLEEIVADVREALAPASLRHLIVSSWSAGYGGVREILSFHPASVDALVLLDSVHAGYTGTGDLQEAGLLPFFAYAYRAVAQDGTMVLTHSSIQPPGYASTTEVADAILAKVDGQREYGGLERQHGVEVKTRFQRGGMKVVGTTGTGKDAHCAHLRMLGDILEEDVLPALRAQ